MPLRGHASRAFQPGFFASASPGAAAQRGGARSKKTPGAPKALSALTTLPKPPRGRVSGLLGFVLERDLPVGRDQALTLAAAGHFPTERTQWAAFLARAGVARVDEFAGDPVQQRSPLTRIASSTANTGGLRGCGSAPPMGPWGAVASRNVQPGPSAPAR
jgi:hypothetical protein